MRPACHLKLGPTCHCHLPRSYLLLFFLNRSRPQTWPVPSARLLAELGSPGRWRGPRRRRARHPGGEAPSAQARARERTRALLNSSSPRGAGGARLSRSEARGHGGARLARPAARPQMLERGRSERGGSSHSERGLRVCAGVRGRRGLRGTGEHGGVNAMDVSRFLPMVKSPFLPASLQEST
jgi:hypothetical protein